MAEFSSRAVGGTALGLAAGALGVELLNGGMNGLLGGLFGNRNNGATDVLAASILSNGARTGCGCSEDHCVNRYEAGKDARIAELETEVKLRDANTYTDQKLLEVYKYFDGKVECINQKLCDQAVWNTAQTGTISCMAQQIAALNGLTKLVIPGTSLCPEAMPRYNSWTAPTTTTTAG
jgi:hypothetical protein